MGHIVPGGLVLPGSQNQKGSKIDHHENTNHDRNVIVGQDTKPQTNTVHKPILFLHQPLQSKHDQGEQKNTVQPHNVPAVGGHIAGQGIKDPEKSNAKIISLTVLFQIIGKGQPRKTDLQHNPVGHKLNDQLLGTQKQKPV